jgi:predicted membrane protein
MRNLTAGFIFIVLGFLLLLDNLEIADFGYMIGHYWPLLLIIWGLSIIMRNKGRSTPSDTIHGQGSESELLHESNVFGNISLNISSKNFKGGSLSTVFGDCNLDLSQSTIADGEHILRIHSVFGNSLILLPKDAAVSVSAGAVFGELNLFGQHKGGFSSDIQTSTPDYASVPNRLKIIVSKVFGDVKIV